MLEYISTVEAIEILPADVPRKKIPCSKKCRTKYEKLTTKWNFKGFFYKSAIKWFLLLKSMEEYALHNTYFVLRITIETVVERKFLYCRKADRIVIINHSHHYHHFLTWCSTNTAAAIMREESRKVLQIF